MNFIAEVFKRKKNSDRTAYRTCDLKIAYRKCGEDNVGKENFIIGYLNADLSKFKNVLTGEVYNCIHTNGKIQLPDGSALMKHRGLQITDMDSIVDLMTDGRGVSGRQFILANKILNRTSGKYISVSSLDFIKRVLEREQKVSYNKFAKKKKKEDKMALTMEERNF